MKPALNPQIPSTGFTERFRWVRPGCMQLWEAGKAQQTIIRGSEGCETGSQNRGPRAALGGDGSLRRHLSQN